MSIVTRFKPTLKIFEQVSANLWYRNRQHWPYHIGDVRRIISAISGNIRDISNLSTNFIGIRSIGYLKIQMLYLKYTLVRNDIRNPASFFRK